MLYTLRRAAKESTNLLKNAKLVSGYEPPLYDRNPSLWTQWAWGLLAMDVLFTVASCDLIFNHWTEHVVKDSASETSKISNQNAGGNSGNSTKTPTVTDAMSSDEWVLRPLWQRLGFATCQLFIGVLVGGGVLMARDRIVCRMRFFRPDNLAASSATARGTVKVSDNTRWLEIKTASGRKKNFMMQHCTIAPGRNDTEMFLKVQNTRGRFTLGMNDAKVLGQTETNLKSLQSRLLAAWYNRPAGSIDRSGWTGGPVAAQVK